MALKNIIGWIKQSLEDYCLELESLDDDIKEAIYLENLYRNW